MEREIGADALCNDGYGGTPDGKAEFDEEMAARLLRLVSGASSDGQEPGICRKYPMHKREKIARRLVERFPART